MVNNELPPKETLPEMKEVSSSNIAAVGYKSETKELYVRFLTGAVYKYAEVPKTIYDGIFTADSVGCYINKSVKKVYTTYTRVL